METAQVDVSRQGRPCLASDMNAGRGKERRGVSLSLVGNEAKKPTITLQHHNNAAGLCTAAAAAAQPNSQCLGVP